MINASRLSRGTQGMRASLALVLALPLVSALHAQTAPVAPTKPADETVTLESLVITGSAIPTAEGETFSPVTIYSPAEMARLGAATPIEVVRHLPGFTGAVATEQRTNGGNGAAGVNLRGLAGTLTLLDGKRTAAFDNFNVIPLIAVQRIEVVKDGAGSIYGSDALSGVFNTMLVSHYNGSKLDAYYGNTWDNDAGVTRIGGLSGITRGKTNLVLGAEYYTRHALHAIDRVPSDSADQRFRGGLNGGSPVFSGRATARVGSATAAVQDLVLAPGKTVGLTAADFVAFDPVTSTSNQLLNFRRYTPSIPAQERSSFFGTISHKLFDDRVEAYARLIYTGDNFYSGLAPAPMPLPGTAASAARDLLLATRASPQIPTGFFIQDDVRSAAGAILNGAAPFRTLVLGPRLQMQRRDAWDFAAGLKGRIGREWAWNFDYVYGVLYRDEIQGGAPSKNALVQRIRSGAYNPWALDDAKGTGPTGVAFDNAKALQESSASGKTDVEIPNRGFDFNINGTIATLPAGELKMGLGADYYRLDSASIPEPIFFTGDLLGLNGSNPTISRSYGTGIFAAVQAPIIGPGMNIPLIRSLKLQLEGRYDYQTVEGYQGGASGLAIGRSFTVQNPKVGLQWNPVADLLIRGTWGTGFRLPTLPQLFNAPGSSVPQLRDPLGFPIPNQTTITTSGNPNLSPEESKTYSVGLVFSPKAVEGLSVTVDYYYGAIEGLVGEGAQFILDTNARGQPSFVAGNPASISPNAPFANLITRAASGSVTTVNSTNFNISARETTGVEWAVTYAWPRMEIGKFTSKVEWNTALSWDLTAVEGQPPQSFLGVYIDTSSNAISPGSLPKHKGYVSQMWEKGNWAVLATANYISKLQDNPANTLGGVIRYIEPWVTLDASIEYKFAGGGQGWRKWFEKSTVRLGGANLTDETAPFAAGAFNDGYDVKTHSNRGRFLFAQVTKKF